LFLIEGTHDFGLRGFVGAKSFPIKEFWSWGKRTYDDRDFRVNRYDCDIYQAHNGDWVTLFVQQLRGRHIEWSGLDKIG
jgi:hypothetical protein